MVSLVLKLTCCPVWQLGEYIRMPLPGVHLIFLRDQSIRIGHIVYPSNLFPTSS